MAAGRDKSFSVEIPGLRELQRDLKGQPSRIDKDLRKRLKARAGEVAADAKSNASSAGDPRPGAAAIKTIKAASSGTDARVTFGGPKAPHALGHEFGSLQYTQFPPWTGRGKDAGRFFYPAVRKAQKEGIAQDFEDIVNAIARAAFND